MEIKGAKPDMSIEHETTAFQIGEDGLVVVNTSNPLSVGYCKKGHGNRKPIGSNFL